MNLNELRVKGDLFFHGTAGEHHMIATPSNRMKTLCNIILQRRQRQKTRQNYKMQNIRIWKKTFNFPFFLLTVQQPPPTHGTDSHVDQKFDYRTGT